MSSPTLLTRRSFLNRTAALGVASTLPLTALAQYAGAAPPGPNDGLLLVIFLRGGNDALNTVGPFDNGVYRDKRGSLAISPGSARSVGGGLYMHPSLRYLHQRFSAGDVAILPGVGEPSLDRSHFTQTTTWMTAIDRNRPRGAGWLGRWLDSQPEHVLGASVDGGSAQQINGQIPKVIGVGRNTSTLLPNGGFERATNNGLVAHSTSDLSPMGELFSRQLAVAAQFSEAQRPLYGSAYPKNEPKFVADIRRAAGVLNLGLGARVVSSTVSGYDTHKDQAGDHADLLADLDHALEVFFSHLLPALHGQTAVLVVSEFGRRLKTNGSNGTDHGAAGVAFLIGDRVNGAVHGLHPSLTDLDRRGDMKFHTDFRQVYATVAEDWLMADPVELLDGNYGTLPLFQTPPEGSGVAGFLDVDNAAFYAGALRWAAANDVINGVTATTFEPATPMSRGQFATILWRQSGSPAPRRTIRFADVAPGSYYEQAIMWMAAEGITTGVTTTTFEPDSLLTRGDVATFLWRWSGQPSMTGPTFSDVDPLAYFSGPVKWMAAEGITTGVTATTFEPHQLVSRAQAITFLWRHAGAPGV